jgi:predicted GH43/DUF377 family glycosyl hydrolase
VSRDTRKFFVRDPKNPILRASDWPYPAHTVFNPGATILADGTTLVLCRVEERTGLSHLCAARSTNGVDRWTIDPQPTMPADPAQRPEELWGVEDPRISFLPELERYAITYTAFSQSGPGVALALTKDFRTFEHRGLVMTPHDKNAAVLPRRIGGRWAMLHRPSHDGRGDVWMSFSPDLRSWGDRRVILAARRGGWWDAEKIGLSAPPLETAAGWLTLYHGVRRTASGSIYRVGAALFDRERPEVCIARGTSWIFAPEEPYETDGDVPRVVFPCGMTSPDGETLRIYYGAADSSIGLAHGRVSELLAWLAEPENQVSPP